MKKLVFVLFLISILIVGCKEESGKATNISGSKENGGSADLMNMLGERATTYSVSYDTSAMPGSGKEVTMSFKGTKIRYDTVANVEGQETTTSVFILDGKTYACTEKPQKMCLQTGSSGEAGKTTTGAEDIESNPDKYSITSLPSRTIAGTTAKCYSISSAAISSDICYSKEGVLLYIKSNESEITATSYTINVPDSTFELPSAPQDMSAIMQKYQK